jgi:predicted dehydrogenase
MAALKSESWNLEKGDALLAETRSFVDAIVEDKPCEVSGEDGFAALELAEQIVAEIEKRSGERLGS